MLARDQCLPSSTRRPFYLSLVGCRYRAIGSLSKAPIQLVRGNLAMNSIEAWKTMCASIAGCQNAMPTTGCRGREAQLLLKLEFGNSAPDRRRNGARRSDLNR